MTTVKPRASFFRVEATFDVAHDLVSDLTFASQAEHGLALRLDQLASKRLKASERAS